MRDSEPASLEKIELLSDVPGEELRNFEARCAWRRYEAREQILDRDSDSRDVFLVAKGSVHVKNFSFSGREIAFATIGAGGYFGELSAIDNEPRSATVVAAERCLLAVMSPAAFGELLATHPAVAMRVLKRLAAIVRICDERIMDLSTLGAVQRVYLELLRMAKPDAAVPRLWSIYPFPTQADVAGRASTTRETVARVLGQLVAAGLILRKGKTLYLNDREKLRILAQRLEREQESLISR